MVERQANPRPITVPGSPARLATKSSAPAERVRATNRAIQHPGTAETIAACHTQADRADRGVARAVSPPRSDAA
jgi:hypothetical protein